MLESIEETLSAPWFNERSQTKTPYTSYITSLLPFGVNDLLKRLTESTVIDDAKHLVTHAGKEEMRVSNFIKKFHHAMPGSYQGFSWEFASSFVSSTWAIFTHLTMLNESNTEGVVETMAYLMALPRHSRITINWHCASGEKYWRFIATLYSWEIDKFWDFYCHDTHGIWQQHRLRHSNACRQKNAYLLGIIYQCAREIKCASSSNHIHGDIWRVCVVSLGNDYHREDDWVG